MKELNLSINKSTKHANDVTDFNSMTEDKRQESLFVDGPATYRIAQDLSSLDKSKSLGYSEDKMKSSIGFCLDRSEDTNTSMDTAKDYPVAFGRPVKDEKQLAFSFDEIGDFQREPRSKGVHFSLDRGKELTFPKTYNHPLDGKDFGFALDPRRDVGAFSLDRFRGSAFRDNTVVPDAADYRVTQIPTRNPELEAITMERIRRSHVLTPDLPTRNLSAHLSHSHAIVHMQHSHQQQQQPQCKSFTIDAILGLRNNQRHKQQRSQQHPYRKHQGQEGSAKTNSLGSSSNGGGKLKRVRTIFTAEQLERLEAAFARQQYMVGPERLYLAHELGLSEAQRSYQQRNDYASKTFKIAYKKSTNDNYESTEVLETISEHTEPSPTASGTMNQTELETQTQMRKTRTGRIVAPRSAATCSSGLPTEGNNVVDPHWKPRPTQSFPHNRECRRSDYDATEPISGCYSASNTYRSKYPSVPSGFSKLPQSASFDQAYRVPQQNLRTTRNKILTGKSFANNNYAVVRKNCYKPDPEDEEEAKYEEEDGTYAQDNAEDEVGDEADEDPDENEEYHDKEYEEQEADDEIDDESDAFQTQLHRAQPTAAKGSTLRNQHPRPRPPDQQREFNKIQCRQRMAQLYQDQKMPRYCPPSYDPERVSGNDTSYGDVITDDERTPPSSPSRRTTPRVSEIRQGISAWQPPRKSLERNHARLIPVSSHQRHQQQEHHHQLNRHNRPQPQQQPSRRPRTMKPEMESLMIPQTTNTNVKKCCVCGRATNPIAVKLDLARRGTSRLNECRGFTVNGPTGEDGETEESVVCGRCANFPAMEEIRASCDGSSRPGSLYAGKMHRSRLQNPKMYETTDDQTMDDMLSVFESAPQRSGGTGYSAPRERPRHSLQPTRSPSRRGRFFER